VILERVDSAPDPRATVFEVIAEARQNLALINAYLDLPMKRRFQ
jgi:hypothetical protein